jgi:acetyl/propionyl-CoA carboxylase alpha subunit
VSFQNTNGEEIQVAYRKQRDDSFQVSVDDREHLVTVYCAGGADGAVDLEIDQRRIALRITQVDQRWYIHGGFGDLQFEELPRFPLASGSEFKGGLTAPMPGNVLATHVAEGDTVSEGQLLLILEAMKMEHRITAPINGTVTQLLVAEGDQVANGEMLVLLEEEGE